MKILLKYMIAAGIVLAGTGSFAQQSTVLDGLYIKEHAPARKVIPYTHLREGDVMWLKRVWRVIDLRQKINHPMYYPISPINDRKSLFDVIKEAVMNEGTITAYDPGVLGDDEFTMPMTADAVKGLLFKSDTGYTEDIDTGELVEVLQTTETKTENVKQYKIKEEWFFDNQRSVMDVRIIGICPMVEKIDEFGEFKGFMELFWIYFPEARYVFANADVFNRQNDAERRTYEDIFWKRQFGSYIVKESNVYDRAILEYKTGLDALLEAEKIKNDLFLLEHDLWHF